MIKQVSIEDFSPLYKEHITRDFARNERRPLFAIERMMREGRYACYVLDEGEGMLAYACLITAEGAGGTLLDYFAVMPGQRGGGIGGRFLEALRAHCTADGIVIESEMPSHASDAADAETRTRRIAFYTRHGAELSGYGWHAFGVDYNLLWLPVRKALAQTDIAGDIQRLYSGSNYDFIVRMQTRVYPLEG